MRAFFFAVAMFELGCCVAFMQLPYTPTPIVITGYITAPVSCLCFLLLSLRGKHA